MIPPIEKRIYYECKRRLNYYMIPPMKKRIYNGSKRRLSYQKITPMENGSTRLWMEKEIFPSDGKKNLP